MTGIMTVACLEKLARSNRDSGAGILKKLFCQRLLILAWVKEYILFTRNSAAYPARSKEAK